MPKPVHSGPKTKFASGWAIVTPRGKIKVNTVYPDRESVLNIFNDYDRERECKVRRVTVICEMK